MKLDAVVTNSNRVSNRQGIKKALEISSRATLYLLRFKLIQRESSQDSQK